MRYACMNLARMRDRSENPAEGNLRGFAAELQRIARPRPELQDERKIQVRGMP